MLHVISKQKNEKTDISKRKYSYPFERLLRNVKNSTSFITYEESSAFYHDNYVESETFEDYVASMWQLAIRARSDPHFPPQLRESLLRGLSGIDIDSPTFKLAVMELQHKVNFNPRSAKKVDLFPPPEIPKLPTFETPAQSPILLKGALRASALYPQFNEGFLTSCYGKYGRRVALVAGNDMQAYFKKVEAMNVNIVSPDEQLAPEFHLAAMKYTRKWGVKTMALKFQINYDKLVKVCSKDSSIGYIPADFYEIVDGAVKRASGLKKRDIAEFAVDMFADYVKQLEEWVDHGKSASPPTLIIADQEMLKYEIIFKNEVFDNPEVTPEELDDSLCKVRLFYMSSIFDYILSQICYKPLSESLRFYESAIGVKVESGGLQSIWEILGQKFSNDDRERVYEKWKNRGIDLSARRYGQGDWKTFDQSLLGIGLAFVVMFAWPFFSQTEGDQDPKVRRVMFKQFVISNVQKIMHIYAHGTYEVFGQMFSGKFTTSTGDTLYQMFIKMIYLGRLLRKFKDDELLQDCVTLDIISFFFYGDDHLAGWPRVLDDKRYFLYEDSDTMLADFISFCTRVLGMNHKKEEFKIFDNLYGRRYFDSIDGVFVENCSMSVEGPTFLKNQVSKIYVKLPEHEDYTFIEKLPYRGTRELSQKLTLTLKSTANIKTAAMSLMSIARLCTGNLEAYCMAKVLYDQIKEYAGDITDSDWDYYSTIARNSAKRVMKRGNSFPSLDELIHEQRSGTGFVPKDFNGMESPQSYLYSNSDKGNVQSNFAPIIGNALAQNKHDMELCRDALLYAHEELGEDEDDLDFEFFFQ